MILHQPIKIALYCLLIVFFLSVLTITTAAQEETAQDTEPEQETTTETDTEDDSEGIKEKINDLKDRLATRVAELREQNKRSFYGVIKEVDDTKITLLYNESEVPVALDDESTYYTFDTSGQRSQTDKDNFTLGETAVVFGTLDLDNKTIVATYLYSQTPPLIEYGFVTATDEDNGTFTIDSSSGSIVLDYEISTQCTVIEEGEKTRCGLSGISVGDRVFLRIEPDEEEIAHATALRILLVPQADESQDTDEESEDDEEPNESI